MHDSSKAICYRVFKNTCHFENYLEILNDKDRTTLCKFRTTNHRFIVETGRWQQIEYMERKCPHCNSQQIGDEFHYLLECKTLSAHRILYINKYYWSRPNIIKFNELMNTTNIEKLKKMCTFIRIINNIICLP